jgi:hypothetical protein
VLKFGSSKEDALSARLNKKFCIKTDKLPIGIRLIVYSYLPLEFLLTKISCLSKKDREMLVSDTELLN